LESAAVVSTRARNISSIYMLGSCMSFIYLLSSFLHCHSISAI
jgi:hypothetical protein